MKIAFAGKMGVGKDTAYEYIAGKYDKPITNIKFAQGIYDILKYSQTICNFTHVKDRRFLQLVGDWARDNDPNVWVNLALQKASETDHCIITDLRYLNEFKKLKDNGWMCIKIVRSDIQENRKGTGTTTHSSETSIDLICDESWDYVIENNNNIDHFYKNIDYVLNELTLK